MKNFIKATAILAVGLMVLNSCYSPKLMADDDVYVIKNNKLPLGESMSDETSYANYRASRDDRGVSSSFYDDDFLFWRQRRPYSNMWAFGFYHPYYMNGGMYSFPHYGSTFYSGYYGGYGHPFYFYDPFYSPFGYYPMNNSFFYNQGYYGNNWGTPINNFNVNYNHHSGPRGTSSGFSNPGFRNSGTNIIKSTPISSKPGNQTVQYQRTIDRSSNIGSEVRKTVRPQLTNSKPARGGNQFTPTTDRLNRPSGRIENTVPSRINNTPVNNSPRPQRTITPSNNGSRGGGISPSSNGGSNRSGGSPTQNGANRRN